MSWTKSKHWKIAIFFPDSNALFSMECERSSSEYHTNKCHVRISSNDFTVIRPLPNNGSIKGKEYEVFQPSIQFACAYRCSYMSGNRNFPNPFFVWKIQGQVWHTFCFITANFNHLKFKFPGDGARSLVNRIDLKALFNQCIGRGVAAEDN